MTQENDPLYSYRCACGKLLFKGLLHDSTIQIKCKRCGRLTSFQGSEDSVTETDEQFAMMFNRSGDIVSASSNIKDLLGYPIAELLTRRHHELLPSQSQAVIGRHFGKLWELKDKERYVFRIKATYRHKDGHPVPGYMQSKFVPAPGRGVVLFSSFTLQPPAESSPEFSTLSEYPLFMNISPSGICLDASTARKRPFVRPRDEIVGRPLTEFMHENENEKQKLLDMLRRYEPFELLGKRFLRVDGSPVRMDTFFIPNFNKAGTCVDYSLYVYDHVLLRRFPRRFAIGAKA